MPNYKEEAFQYAKKEKRVLRIYLKKIMAENFSSLKKKTYPDTSSTEGPKQDKPKQTYTKTYYNKNGKC